jgi:hypothetical protein
VRMRLWTRAPAGAGAVPSISPLVPIRALHLTADARRPPTATPARSSSTSTPTVGIAPCRHRRTAPVLQVVRRLWELGRPVAKVVDTDGSMVKFEGHWPAVGGIAARASSAAPTSSASMRPPAHWPQRSRSSPGCPRPRSASRCNGLNRTLPSLSAFDCPFSCSSINQNKKQQLQVHMLLCLVPL